MFRWLRRQRRRRSRAGSPDYLMMIVLGCILVFGLLMLASASSEIGQRDFGDSYYYLVQQLTKGVMVGFLVGLVLYFLPYEYLRRFSVLILIFSIILLILVFTPLGAEMKGAARWLEMGPVSMQPSEIIKFSFLTYLASWLAGRGGQRRVKSFKEGFLPFLVVSGIISVLLFFQPATSVVIIILFSALVMYFVGGGKMLYIATMMAVVALAVALLIIITPYRMDRVTSYVNFLKGDIEENKQDSLWHLNQSLITIGTGGMFGEGYGQSINKSRYLPEPIGDSIFAVVAAEFGFIGSALTILFFFLFTLRGLLLSRKMPDDFSRNLMVGFSALIAIQVFIHIGANSGLVPLTGIPLPFISFGSTAMVVFLAMAAVMLNMSREARK